MMFFLFRFLFLRYWKAFCEGVREGIEEELNRRR